MGKRWRLRLESLLKDPDAAITRPKVIVPSDYVRVPPPNLGIPMILPPEYRLRTEN